MGAGRFFFYFSKPCRLCLAYHRETKAAAAANDCTTNLAAAAASKKI